MNTSSAKGRDFLKEYFEKSNPIIKSYLDEKLKEAKEIGVVPAGALEHFMRIIDKGKRLRGALVVLGYLALGGEDLEAIYDLSTFIEIFHSGILIQDDFMDNDPIRRGVTTIHKEYECLSTELGVKQEPRRYGESVATCLGDGAFYMAWEKILNSSFPDDLKIKAGIIYSKYSIRLLHGQILDVTITGAPDLDEKDVLNVIWTKSGEYTSLLPLKVGAILAGAGEENKRMKALEDYARCFGWAFQIQDDVLGIFGDEEEFGKPVGSDIREGKNTLFMLHLSKSGTPGQIKFKNRVLGNPDITKRDIEKMGKILKETGSYDHVINMGWTYVEEGKKFIPKITRSKELREIFESLIVYMMERTK